MYAILSGEYFYLCVKKIYKKFSLLGKKYSFLTINFSEGFSLCSKKMMQLITMSVTHNVYTCWSFSVSIREAERGSRKLRRVLTSRIIEPSSYHKASNTFVSTWFRFSDSNPARSTHPMLDTAILAYPKQINFKKASTRR